MPLVPYKTKFFCVTIECSQVVSKRPEMRLWQTLKWQKKKKKSKEKMVEINQMIIIKLVTAEENVGDVEVRKPLPPGGLVMILIRS